MEFLDVCILLNQVNLIFGWFFNIFYFYRFQISYIFGYGLRNIFGLFVVEISKIYMQYDLIGEKRYFQKIVYFLGIFLFKICWGRRVIDYFLKVQVFDCV